MPEEIREDFVIQTPESVATSEAGMHTLASPGAGLGLSGSDTYGLTGEAKGQFRIVVGRFVHQRLAMVGLCIFLLLAIGAVLVGHFWQFSYTDITEQPQRPALVDQPLRHQLHRQRHVRPGHGRGGEGH